MTKLIDRELTRDADILERGKVVKKSKGDVVSVTQTMINDHPSLFADVGEAARLAKKNTADVAKLKSRINELEKHNKALIAENKALKGG